MKQNMIEKLYILSFTLDEDPETLVRAVTESFRQAMDFKKVIVYKQCQEGFRTLSSSPLPNVCHSNLCKIKNHLTYDISNQRGKKTGELCIVPKGGIMPSKRKTRFISAFTAQLGIIMERMSFPENIEETCLSDEIAHYRDLAAKDGLTGLYNRNYFEEYVEKMDKQGPHPFSVIMVDVDGLKLINDTLGHFYGDEALKATANLLKMTFRREDIVVRLGGDEFIVLLPGTPLSIVEERCRVLHEALKRYNKKNKHLPIHFSVGFATSSAEGDSIKSVLDEADKKMYRQKQTNHLYFGDHLKSAYLSFRTVSMEGAAVV